MTIRRAPATLLLAAVVAVTIATVIAVTSPARASLPVAASTVPPGTAPPATEMSPEEIAAWFPPAHDTSRIVPLNGDIAEVVYALGFGDHVVATDISATYPEEAADSPKIGYQRTLNAETILAFEPTLAIADDRAGPPEVLDALRAAGVEVVVVAHHSDIQAPVYKVRAVASTLGAVDEGEAIVDAYEQSLADAEAIAAGSSEQPGVLTLYLRGTRVTYVFGEGSGDDAVIEAAGGRDIGTALGVGEFGELSTEAIIEAAPDFILVSTTGLESIGGIDGLLAIPGIAETPAGEDPERRVLQFEDQLLFGLGPRTGQMVAELAAAIHDDQPR